MSITAYPLTWPAGWKRISSEKRIRARFSKSDRQYNQSSSSSWMRRRELSIADGANRVIDEIAKLGVDRSDVIVSTNIRTKSNGLPYSDNSVVQDPGAAVYWKSRNKQQKCMAIDRYDRVADNLGAVAATIAAMRMIERHGGAEILDRAFTGFVALPAPEQWWQALGFDDEDKVTLSEAESRYRTLAKKHHPDVGGNAGRFASITDAINTARERLGA